MVGTLLMSSGVVLMATATSAQAAADKVFVCKYVGKPGVDERLKAGKQPISVSSSSTAGGWFADGHDFSFVVGPDNTDPGPEDDPPASVCPSVDKPGDHVVTTTEDGDKDCETGARERTRTVTTGYVLSADGHTWVLGAPGEPVYGPWTTRPLTAQERLALDCDEVEEPKTVRPVAYDSTDPTCEMAGSLVVRYQPEGVTATQSPAGTGPGTYTITFTAANGFVLDGAATQTLTVPPKLTGDECDDEDDEVDPTSVRPVPYGTTEPTCDVAGSLVVKGQPEGVTATQSPAGTGPGAYTVTFTAAKGFVLDGPSTQTVTVPAQLTGEACGDNGGGVNTPLPAVPQPQPAVQPPPVTEQPPAVVKGVTESKTPKAAKPRPVVAPAAAPKAAPAPAVMGVQAPAVPTAVSAGLGSLPAAGPVPGDLGRLLAAGGLTLLLAAGGLALGRRTARFVGA